METTKKKINLTAWSQLADQRLLGKKAVKTPQCKPIARRLKGRLTNQTSWFEIFSPHTTWFFLKLGCEPLRFFMVLPSYNLLKSDDFHWLISIFCSSTYGLSFEYLKCFPSIKNSSTFFRFPIQPKVVWLWEWNIAVEQLFYSTYVAPFGMLVGRPEMYAVRSFCNVISAKSPEKFRQYCYCSFSTKCSQNDPTQTCLDCSFTLHFLRATSVLNWGYHLCHWELSVPKVWLELNNVLQRYATFLFGCIWART